MTRSRMIEIKIKKLAWLLPPTAVIVFLAIPYSSKSVTDALRMCAYKLVPSLFPFMVISDLLLRGGLTDTVKRVPASPSRSFFGLPPSADSAWLFGAICGFPVGARLTARLCESGEISKDEASLLLALSSAASPAFVIGTVGRGVLQSERAGIILYFLHLAINFLVCVIISKIMPLKPGVRSRRATHQNATHGFAAAFTESLQSSVLAMLCVIGYVIFFSVISDYLSLIPPLKNCDLLRAVANSAIEMTGGISAASKLVGISRTAVCAFAISFSGLSVLAQSAAFASPLKIDLRRLFVAKLLGGVLSALACLVGCRLSLI